MSGVVIASELQDQPLDSPALRPFWKTCADLGIYVFIHPLPRAIRWNRMDADDLGRMLGWEFSLMVAVVRIINCGLLDALPDTRFSGSVSRMVPTVDRAKATVTTKVRFDRLDDRILPDMSAKVSFLSQRVDVPSRR